MHGRRHRMAHQQPDAATFDATEAPAAASVIVEKMADVDVAVTAGGQAPAAVSGEYAAAACVGPVQTPEVKTAAGVGRPHYLLIGTVGLEEVTLEEAKELLAAADSCAHGDGVSLAAAGVTASSCPFGAHGHIGGEHALACVCTAGGPGQARRSSTAPTAVLHCFSYTASPLRTNPPTPHTPPPPRQHGTTTLLGSVHARGGVARFV